MKSTAVFLTVILCLTLLHFNNEKASAASDKYLVMVEQKDGTWKSYTSLIEKTSNGNLMIKAKSISSALGLNYKYKEDGTFTITKSSTRYNSYKKNSKSYSYTNGSDTTKKTSQYKAYYSRTKKSNLISVSTLSTLVNYKYFSGSTAKKYGYTGIICYSTYNNIPTSVPTVTPEPTKKPEVTKKVEPTKKPEPTKAPTPKPTEAPTPTEKPVSGDVPRITIEGIVIEGVSEFTGPEEIANEEDSWGNTDDLYELADVLREKNPAEAGLELRNNTISFSHSGSDVDGIKLIKSGNEYKLELHIKLAPNEYTSEEVAKLNQSILKAMIYKISGEAEKVAFALIDDWSGDEIYGINKSTWTTIGDCKIKYQSGGGYGIYLIKTAD